ncbi:MAG: hypothetical protein KDB60_00320 [Propionibacteriaceae bacterium]|nr:hypothetical protein [Propionibacteriaceae bacterium]
MLRFASVDEFVDVLGAATKWRRAAEAMRRADRTLPEVTRSIGDSLTYRLTSAPDLPVLTGHRRYLELRHVMEGRAIVEVAPNEVLEPAGPYDDLSDSQTFIGGGVLHELRAGDTVVVGVDEAIRDLAVEGHVIVLRVTVEEH